MAMPGSHTRQYQGGKDGHEGGEDVEAQVTKIKEAVGQDCLDDLVEESQCRGDGEGERRRGGIQATVAFALNESLVDKGGHDAVLDEVGALLWKCQAREHNDVNGGDAQRNADLHAARPRL